MIKQLLTRITAPVTPVPQPQKDVVVPLPEEPQPAPAPDEPTPVKYGAPWYE